MELTIDTIRKYCGFKSPNGIRQTWNERVHTQIPFPHRHQALPFELAEPLLKYMAQPGNGRKPQTIQAAAALLESLKTGVLPPLTENGENSKHQPKVTVSVKSANGKPFFKPKHDSDSESKSDGTGESTGDSKPESVSDSKPPKPVSQITLREWFVGTFGDFMPIDLVTYTSIVLMFVSSHSVIPNWVGLLFGFLLSVALLNALFIVKSQKLKDSGWHAVLGVGMSELIGSALHWTMFYNELKSNYVQLPWQLYSATDDNYSATAFIMSLIVCLWSVYAIYNRINVTKAIAYAKWYKEQHGTDY